MAQALAHYAGIQEDHPLLDLVVGIAGESLDEALRTLEKSEQGGGP